jgi:hypothetical protein
MHQSQPERAGDSASIRRNGYATAMAARGTDGLNLLPLAAAWVRGSRDPVRDELMATLRSHLRRHAARRERQQSLGQNARIAAHCGGRATVSIMAPW